MARPNIAIFNGRLLPASETFVRAQAEGLQQFTPYYIGARRVAGLELPSNRTFVVNQGNLLGSAQEILFKKIGFAPHLYQQMKQKQPLLIHAHFGVCGALALPLAQALQIPLIVTYHGFDACMTDEYARHNSISTQVYLHRRETLKKKAQLFIAVSEFIRGKLINQGFPQHKIQVHHIGVDTETFQPNSDVAREPIVLFVGRLTEKKGCEYLIRAMAQVQSFLNNVQLVVIGDGPLSNELKALAAKSLHRYQFLGVQPSDVVRSWMSRASVLVAPSITTSTGDSEGLPMVLIEAQAMGLPVVSSIHAGIPEAIVHEETGFLAVERDWQTLAQYILKLLNEPTLWKRFSVHSRERIQTQFNLQQQTQALETIYQCVLDNTL